jgi:hypothetical protein
VAVGGLLQYPRGGGLDDKHSHVGKGNSRIKPSLQVKRAGRDLFSKP